jgi:cytochrome bd-type quinol oxidase subunit 2
MTVPQIVQWSVVAALGIAGSVIGYFWLQLFTKARICWALFCSIGWILFSIIMTYASMFPSTPNKHEHIIRVLVFADGSGQGDAFQIVAYVVIIWSVAAILINRIIRSRAGR